MDRPRRRLWECLGVFLFCALLCAYFEFQTPFLVEADGYYHMKVAWLMRHRGFFLSGFPWAWFSLWREGFSDGSIVFHLFLIPFTFLRDLATGGKLATVALASFLFTSFFAIVSLNDLKARFYWLWLLLLGGGFFWFRMLDTRPQVLSASLLLWSLHFLLNDRRKEFAALSFVYPLSYVAAFLPQVFAVIQWAYRKAFEKRDERGLVYAGLGAYALATLVHPYFPKNLTFFAVQNFYVMFLAMTQKVNLYLAAEFLPLDTRVFVGGHAPLLATLAGLAILAMHRRAAFSEKTRVLFPVFLTVGLLACGSKRFVEYAVPVGTLFCAFLFNDLFAGVDEEDFVKEHGRAGQTVVLAILVAMGVASGVEARIVRGDMARISPPRFESLARTLAREAPAGELIFTCDWDEPPELFYFNDQHRYPVMMDPTFMYYWDPKTWKLWFDVSNARLTPDATRAALSGTFGARYGLCGAKFSEFRRLIDADPHFRVLDENERGFVFELRP